MADLGHRHAAGQSGLIDRRWLADNSPFLHVVCELFEPMSSRESWGKLRDGRDVEKLPQIRAG